MSAMHRNASLCEVVWEEGEIRTGGRLQLHQVAQPHQQRRCTSRMRLPVTKRAHRAVSRLDGLAQARQV